MHLRISLATFALRRTERRNDRGAYDGAALQEQPLLGQVSVDLLEDVFGQIAGLQLMAEVRDGRLVGNRLQTESGERAQRGDLIQGVFRCRVAQGEPVRHQVHAQHGLQRVGTRTSACHWIVDFDDLERRLPRHHHFHLGKEDFALRLLPLAHMLDIRKLIWLTLVRLCRVQSFAQETCS